MTYRVGPKGQVVIPKAIRDELGILPGDQVDVRRQEGEVVIRRHRDSALVRCQRVKQFRGLMAHTAGGGTGELEATRRADREREQRKAQKRG